MLCYAFECYVNQLTIILYGHYVDVIGQVVACEELDNYDKNGKAGKKKPITIIDAE